MQTKLLAVLLKSARRHVKAEVEIEIAVSSLRLPSGISKSTLARRLELLVENSSEPERPVVIEMLRQVVLGNFGAINGTRGDKAQGILDQMYPSGGALPGFHRSNWDNASGMFVRNALLDETRDPSYAVLCGLVVKMIDGGWMEPPEIEVPRLPESARLSIDGFRALLRSK